ncbi:hypothetical protein [Streptomyces subrutilus]|uniref:Uncharacterized protein n=1 Tax=Streptomyces subrutilus TaxID=36818 RepID=A0A5P2UII6_9ACTN|nr:hypothetical protein [Streptomyces subrutilus]QEU79053.1 hypothetical protein CP968_12735 [Streptomyces subrutilus]WSJ31765.1 hypothetical protein OG479_22160 [Streptomyces subrutilus]GGZ76888.1 hypothetical protein GCM10010371_40790 [Streptomyces subrutilus]
MKLRNTAGAALAAFALVLSLPASAFAAQGYFHYKFVDGFGQEQHITLHDPHSGKCINLYGVGDDDEEPGYGPHNDTDAAVTVYLGVGCSGPEWTLRAKGKPARDDLQVRSVRFHTDRG